jgi:phosphate transport system permease protein
MKKRIRWSEFFIEKGIAGIAFLSLASIFLIFVFVFREAAPILDSNKVEGHGDVPAHAEDGVGEAESYGDPVGEAESYGDPAPTPEAVGPAETYGDPEPATTASVEGPETYGEPEATASDTLAGAGTTDSVTPAAMEAPLEQAVADETDAPSHQASLVRNLLLDVWQPVGDEPKYGIPPLLMGSFKVALIALLIAAPIGIFAALFTSTFAPRWAKETMKPVIEILAGIPSVVIGFFALTILATLVQNLFGLDYRLNALVGGIAMSLAVIPLIYTLSEDSLASIPKHYTEGSLALGATVWETNIRVVLPAAIPGIFAAVLLGLGRAFGETMIVLMATGNAGILSLSPVEPVRTVSASIGAEMAEVVFGDQHYTVLFFLGVILFVFSFALNAVAEIFIRQRLAKKFGGAS